LISAQVLISGREAFGLCTGCGAYLKKKKVIKTLAASVGRTAALGSGLGPFFKKKKTTKTKQNKTNPSRCRKSSLPFSQLLNLHWKGDPVIGRELLTEIALYLRDLPA